MAPARWRELMELTRNTARALATDGVIEITQKGRPVDPLAFKGPIRLRLVIPSVSAAAGCGGGLLTGAQHVL